VITLHLAEYDPSWPQQFEEHRRRIGLALGSRATRIEHIGSTSVPGLAAKPVIDIALDGIQPGDAASRAALQDAGYSVIVDERGHAMYAAANRSAHVHVWADPDDFERHLLFRDWLRAHPSDRTLYAHVKRELAKRQWATRDDYAQAKTAVVNTIMRRARGEGSGPRIERFAAGLLEHLPERARILEIGAGEGLLAARLAAAKHDVIALDTQLRSMFPVFEQSFEDYEAPPQSFDCIAAQLVLHHAKCVEELLDKALSLLKPNGLIAIDDYGWERSTDEVFRRDRSDLHTSEAMLAALRERFEQIVYEDHAYFKDGAGEDSLAFTFIGAPR